jgi:hypothetical protein
MCSDEVSWPAGALEEQDYESGQQGEQQLQLTREQVEQEQELMEKQTQDRWIFLLSDFSLFTASVEDRDGSASN